MIDLNQNYITLKQFLFKVYRANKFYQIKINQTLYNFIYSKKILRADY